MKKKTILIMRPEGDDSSPADQTFAARLAAGPEVEIRDQLFRRDEPDDLARQLRSWEGKVAGVIGAMRVPESQQLGQLTERINLLCLVANNNPAVWQKRRNIFHIGFPTSQTTAAVAAELTRNANRRRYLLLHDASSSKRASPRTWRRACANTAWRFGCWCIIRGRRWTSALTAGNPN